MTNASSVPRRTSKLVNEVDERGETVLYDQAGGKLLVLNDVGAGVWALVDGTRTIGEIAAVVQTHLPADPAAIERDLVTFLADLRRHELVAFS